MKKVGFVTTYKNSAHLARGVGFYAERLLINLKKFAPEYSLEVDEDLTGCDLLHYPYFDLFFHSLPIFSQALRIVSVLDVIPLEFPRAYPPGLKGRINLQLQKLALRNTQSVITISNASISGIHKYLGVPISKINLTYLGVDPIFKRMSKPVNKYSLPNKFVLYVGGVNWNKNIPGLVKACEIANLPLVMVGREPADIEKMDLSHPELVHLKGLDLSRVIRLGFVSTEDLVTIYNLASVYCQPSFAEGFGLPVLEALACGTPVAVSDTHSLPELVGDNGRYFDPHDFKDMAKAISNSIGTHPRSVDPKFSWDNTARQVLQTYRNLLYS